MNVKDVIVHVEPDIEYVGMFEAEQVHWQE